MMFEDNINLSNNPREVDWKQTLLSLYMRQDREDGKIILPIRGEDKLMYSMQYTMCRYIHLN